MRNKILELDLKAGKTQAIVKLRGAGSVQVNVDLRVHKQGIIGFQSKHKGPQQLIVVHDQEHLGSVIADDGNMKREAAVRVAKTMAELKPIKPRLIGSPKIAIQCRYIFASSLLFSKLFFIANVWSKLSAEAHNHLSSAYLTILRVVARM